MTAKVIDRRWISVELFTPFLNDIEKLVSNQPSNVEWFILPIASVVDGDYISIHYDWIAAVSGDSFLMECL
jgi:hypothetical protein